jgi:hypothetical protein
MIRYVIRYVIRRGPAYKPAHLPGYKPGYEPPRTTPPRTMPPRTTPPCTTLSRMRQAIPRKREDVKPPVPRRCPMVWGQGTAKPLGNPCVNIC